jgi:prevent-host-death family protein
MTSISAAEARQQWSETIDAARRAPVAITRHRRETVVLMDAKLARRALAALEDTQDLAALEAARAEGGSIPWADVRAELGLS